ncbi:hypothetical protein JOC48_001412 [Aquibacillus albus]|uniref:Uncharacterized protein n=1 Tax=Aquibacillus albus TaxID=1168171 RepID=A0ABS2MYI4_9BACI|nr:hypothetical protein [Aquibacillus albus]
MISDEELAIFIKEIYLLIDEYKRCDHSKTKAQIYDDMLFLYDIVKTKIHT